MDVFESTNINQKWLENIYENIKQIETKMRLSYEGCGSVLDYLMIPQNQRPIVIGEIQYKNLRLVVTEISLLLDDLAPVIDETVYKDLIAQLNKLRTFIEVPSLFIDSVYLHSKSSIVSTQVTPFFYQTLEAVVALKREIIKTISHILYVKEDKR